MSARPSGAISRRSLLAGGFSSLAAAQSAVSERARRLHADAFVFDAHLHAVTKQFYKGGSFGKRLPDGQFDLIRAKEGGLDAMFLTLYVMEDYYPARHETKQVLRLLDEAYRQVDANSDKIALAFTPADIRRINASGRIAAVLDLEGSFDLDGDLRVLRTLHRAGLRSLQLPAHNYTSNFADSCCAEPRFGGLTEHGRDVVRECNRMGIVINVAHAAEKTTIQAAETSRHPIVSTHDGFRRFNNIPRTLTDEAFKAIAATGGVVGFHMGNEFHNRAQYEHRLKLAGKPFYDRRDAERFRDKSITDVDREVGAHYETDGVPTPDNLRMTPVEWFKVVEYGIELAGEDHVGLGTDFDGGPTLPRGMRDVRDYPLLTEAMLQRGWSETRIRKFLGLNMLRVLETVAKG
jgi:membrane dipeptidase